MLELKLKCLDKTIAVRGNMECRMNPILIQNTLWCTAFQNIGSFIHKFCYAYMIFFLKKKEKNEL
jgi:hypothetical protein